ncbi:hypothetical protein PIB30_053276 [Stylosanthes scabra]|uniref:PB1-like domain-containing protein n=1 Tax=Stylosanthes scabra TaxID=79078 RepID=A0ABU6TIZ9_9FABA|nr:hypothetical protein [Stylosanthes scabra]
MVLFDINLFHNSYFGYVDGHMRYLGGKKTVIVENDSDFWSVYEADEQLKRFGYWRDDITALWYKDPAEDNLETSLMQFTTDSDALHMVRIGDLRGSVDLFVVHEKKLQVEGFPEIGWINVGDDEEGAGAGNGEVAGNADGVLEEGGDGEKAPAAHEQNAEVGDEAGGNEEGNENVNEVHENVVGNSEGVENEGSNGDEGDVSNDDVEHGEDENEATNEEQGQEHGVVDDETEESEYVASEENTDSADDVQFTDSEEDFDLNDDGFGLGERGSGSGSANGNGIPDKGKGKLNHDFSHDEGSEKLEEGHGFGDYDASEDDDDDARRNLFLVHKPVEDMANYQWRVGRVYTSRDKFKETVSAYAVYIARGIKFDYCDKKRVIVVCQPNCPFKLYCVKVNEEETWQLRSMNVKHNCNHALEMASKSLQEEGRGEPEGEDQRVGGQGR